MLVVEAHDSLAFRIGPPELCLRMRYHISLKLLEAVKPHGEGFNAMRRNPFAPIPRLSWCFLKANKTV